MPSPMPDRSPRDVVVAIDQGTSSTKALAIDATGAVVGRGSVPISIEHPRPGWVQQDADEIAASTESAVATTIAGLEDRVAALAISNQRESAVVWDLATGRPLGPMLGWQDRRTSDAAVALRSHADRVREITGLPIDPMFSALKYAWLLDQVDPDRTRAAAGELVCGTVDSWLVFHHTGDVRIEVGNASRTGLLDLSTGDWSDELCELYGVPRACLPRVAASNEPTSPVRSWGLDGVRITGILGDSHAALYGHGARTPGSVKVTLGTGSSIMGLLPTTADAPAGLVATVAWGLDLTRRAPASVPGLVEAPSSVPEPVEGPTPVLAFEGNILSSGATLVWLADVLGTTPADLIDLAVAAPAEPDPSRGVDLVPAFAGLGAPWWDDQAQAVMTGFTLGTSRADLARAGVESMALQIEDVLAAAERGTGTKLDTVLVDGGPADNDALVQLLADLTQRIVRRPGVPSLSSLGAAYLAGKTIGLFTDEQVLGFDNGAKEFIPQAVPSTVDARRRRWHQAVAIARTPSSSTTTTTSTTTKEFSA